MKKLSFIIFALLLCVPSLFAGKLKVQLEAFDPSTKQQYGLGIVKHSLTRESWHQMDTMLLSTDGKFELELSKGHYDLVMLHPTSERFNYSIYISEKETVELKLKMDKICIPEKIEFIHVMGNFNNHSPSDNHKMDFNEESGIYTLPNSLKDIPIDQFYFNINWEKNAHTSLLATTQYDVWANLSNIVSEGNQSIVFNPKEYKIGQPEHVLTAINDCKQFNTLSDSIVKMLSSLKNNMSGLRQENSLSPYLQMRENMYNAFLAMKSEFDTKYSDLFVEPEYLFLSTFNPVYIEYYHYAVNQNRIMAQKIQQSDAYVGYIADKALATKKYIEQSTWMPVSFYTSNIDRLDSEIEGYMLNKELDIPHGYFSQFLTNTVENTDNDEIAGTILFSRARNASYRNESRAKIIVEDIKTRFPNFSGVSNGQIATIEASLKTKEGTDAPDFTVETLDGKTISLSSLKGKYVFIDFWGTWCGPCRGEIPNLIKMHNDIPSDKLVILGLSSGDKEEVLREFIAANKINYANAMCSDDILKLFGVNSFPTTFLIDPSGSIVAKNLRGSELSEMVIKQME